MRHDTFKAGNTVYNGARKRSFDIAVQRQSRREELLNNERCRRLDTLVAVGGPGAPTWTETRPEDSEGTIFLESHVQLLFSADEQVQLRGSKFLRCFLAQHKQPPIPALLQTPSVVERLIELMHAPNPALQFEVCWVLTNIVAGSEKQTASVVEAGAIPKLHSLLQSPIHEDIQDQAAWALGNISGSSCQYRDAVLSSSCVEDLSQLANHSSVDLQRTATWALSNLCRGDPPPPAAHLPRLLACLSAVLRRSSADEAALSHACWGIAHLCSGSKCRIQAVIHSGVVVRLVELLGCGSPRAVVPALRAVGNILTGSDDQTQVAINSGALGQLRGLLLGPRLGPDVEKDVCWALSNVAGGSQQQVSTFLASGCLAPVLKLVERDTVDVKCEALWVLKNVTVNMHAQHAQQLLEEGVVASAAGVLRSMDAEVVQHGLDVLLHCLKAGDELGGRGNGFATAFEAAGAVGLVEGFLGCQRSDVQQKAAELLELYYAGVPEEENMGSHVMRLGAGGMFGKELHVSAATPAVHVPS